MIYHTRSQHTSNTWSTTLEASSHRTHDLPHSRRARIEHMIYDTRGQHASNTWSTTLEANTHRTHDLPQSRCARIEHMISHNRGAHASNTWSTTIEVRTHRKHYLPHLRRARYQLHHGEVFDDTLDATRNKSNNNIRFEIYIDSAVLFIFHVLLFLSSTSPSIYGRNIFRNKFSDKKEKKRKWTSNWFVFNCLVNRFVAILRMKIASDLHLVSSSLPSI